MPTSDQLIWLRGDLDVDIVGLPDLEATALYDRAAASSDSVDVQEALVRVYYLRGLLSSSAKLASYKQNQTTENISDIFEHVKYLLKYWEDSLDKLKTEEVLASVGSVRSGKQVRIPTRITEYPTRS